MRVTLNELKQIINEALVGTTQQRIASTVSRATKLARDYVEDGEGASDLKEIAEQLIDLARWMISRHESGADEVAIFAKSIDALAKSAGFWKTPAFLNKDQHERKLANMLNVIKRSQIDVARAIASGHKSPPVQATPQNRRVKAA